nr:hypothetical protein [Tanacetum cinerariifolium]
MGAGSEVPTDSHHTPIVTQPSSSQHKRSKNQGGNEGRKLRFLTLSHKLRKVYLQLPMIHYLVKTKTAQAKEIADLKKRIKNIERKKKSRTSGRMIDNVDQNIEITLVDETHGRMNEEEIFGVDDLDGDKVIMDATAGEEVEQSTKVTEKEVSTDDPVTTAAKPKAITTAATTTTTAVTRPKAKDKEIARKLEAQMKAKIEEEERIAWEKDEANIVVIEQWDEVQAKIHADMEFAQKLQTEEKEQLTDANKARLFMKFLENKRKFFARKKEIKKKNIPPTKAQQRSLMCTYLKNMDGWKPKNLKKKSFDEIQKLFDSAMKRVNTFMDMNTEIVEERSKKTQAEVTECGSKRQGDELEQENAKRYLLASLDGTKRGYRRTWTW